MMIRMSKKKTTTTTTVIIYPPYYQFFITHSQHINSKFNIISNLRINIHSNTMLTSTRTRTTRTFKSHHRLISPSSLSAALLRVRAQGEEVILVPHVVASFRRDMSMAPRSQQQYQVSSSKVIDFASSYINTIRLKIATSLTASMTDSDRQHLLSSLNIHDNKTIMTKQQQKQQEEKEEEEERRTLSIGEAVADAVAKEAAKRKSIFEQEKIEIMKQAEKAAMERVQNDLLVRERKVALVKWEQELEKEKQMEEQQKQLKQETERISSINAAVAAKDDHDHPILGKVLIDFGYKRVHVMSTQKLAAIPVWEKQRVYRHERAKHMAKDKLKSLDLGLPGVVALHETLDGELSIIDGQHRVGMLALLESKKNTNNDDSTTTNNQLNLDQILVEVFPQLSSSSPTHAQDIFIEINKAEPVKLVDMPGVAKASDRRIINDAVSYFEETYPDMFKASQRCRPPHLNVDNLRDAIFAADILKREQIKSKKALIEWIQQCNHELKMKKYGKQCSEGSSSEVNEKALEKAREFDFYLGLDMTWLHRF